MWGNYTKRVHLIWFPKPQLYYRTTTYYQPSNNEESVQYIHVILDEL